MYYVIKYRKKVVFENLNLAFPEKSEKEKIVIAKKFYRHFCDLLLETVKLFSISKKELLKRLRYKNPQYLFEEYEKKKNVLAILGHYNNWEWGTSLGLQSPYTFAPIYKPLNNEYFDKKFYQMRSRFGNELIPMRNTARYLNQCITDGKLIQLIFLTDQSPVQTEVVYCTNFFNQKTPVMLGVEKIARKTRQPVYFMKFRKIKRGYYEVELEKLCDDANQFKMYELTDLHSKVLENLIRENPEYWIWTHRRWKYKPQENIKS
jgi:KDO2-lipid IV(A) lauroyltransferase